MGWSTLVVLVATLTACGARTDKQVCDEGCAKLISCGVQYDATTCSAGCLGNADFLACARMAPVGDCNALALCAWKGVCSGNATPAGTATCNATATCKGTCATNPSPATCYCTCNAALLPAKALPALVADQCKSANCGGACGPAGTAAACTDCVTQTCAMQTAQCTAN